MPPPCTTGLSLIPWCRRNGVRWLLSTGSCTRLTLAGTAIAVVITAGWWACRQITLPPAWALGQQRLSKGVSGDTAALPAMARTCSSSRVTHPAQEAYGAVVKRSFVCKQARSLAGNLVTTGHLRIGSRSIIAILISAG